MVNWCQLDKLGNIIQIALGFTTAPFDNAIEIPENITNPINYNYINGQWVKKEKNTVIESPKKPTIEERLTSVEDVIISLLQEVS